MDFRKKKILITGASGFIGSCLLRRLLKEKAEIHIFIRKQAKLWRLQDVLEKVHVHVVDFDDEKALLKVMQKIKPHIIYHLAAYGAYSHQDNPSQIFQTNIMGSWHLLHAANQVGYELFVNTGTSSEYGYKKKPMKETDILEPASYYASSKAAFTQICQDIARRQKRPIVTLRPFSVYGPYEEPTRFIPTLMRALYFKQPMDLVPSATARDFIYIDDMVEAYLRIGQLKKHAGEVFNIAGGREFTIAQVVKAAVVVTGESTEFRHGKMPSRAWDTTHWVGSNKKANDLLGFSPKVSLKAGLALMWAWYKENHSIYKTR